MTDWRKVMFCVESTSRLVLRGYKLVRRPSGVSRYDPGTSSRLGNTPRASW